MAEPRARRRPGPRAAMAFAPLAMAVLLSNAILPGSRGGGASGEERGEEAAVCEDDIEGFRGCHSDYPTGCTKAARYDAYLNLLKNQLVPPSRAPLKFLSKADFGDLDRNTPRELTRGNHAEHKEALARLGEGRVFAVNGYLYYAQKGGTSESSNCQLPDIDDIDFHIGIGFDAALAAKLVRGPGGRRSSPLNETEKAQITKTSVVVEMTPHYRAQFQPDWTIDLVKSATGLQVRVVGQLLADNEHNNKKDNCAFSGAQDGCWRASVWELHPVTQFHVCGRGTCTDNSSDWMDLADFTPPGGGR